MSSDHVLVSARRPRPPSIPATLTSPVTYVVAASFIVYATYSLTRYRQYLTAGYDLGIFDQAVRAYSRFQAPFVALKGEEFNILGDHFHPIIAVLAPLYWVWDDPRALLVAQSALIAVSCVPIWRYAGRRFSVTVSTLLVVGYALGWPLQGMADFDFHEIAFALPLLGWVLDAWDRRRDAELYVACGLLLLVREDMGAVLLVVGLLRFLQRRPRWPGLAIAGAGTIAFFVVLKVVIPAFAGTDYGYWDYSALGDGMSDAIRVGLTNPFEVIATFFSPGVKSLTLLAFFVPLLFLPLLSPVTLVALPILAERFLADRSALWTTEFHYNAPVWVILFFAAMDGATRLSRLVPSRRVTTTAPTRVSLAVAIVLAAVIALVPLVATGPLAGVSSGMFPLARLVNGEAWAWTDHMGDQQAAVSAIPDGSCVTADDRLVPHLTRANRVTVPGVPAPAPDYYVLDLTEPKPGNPWPLDPSRNPSTSAVFRAAVGQGYVANGVFGQVIVLHRTTDTERSAPCGP